MKEFSIEIEQLLKTFGKTKALDQLTLSVHSNEIIGLIGANGSGKTTLMRILAGLEDYEAGKVRCFRKDPWSDLDTRTRISFHVPPKQEKYRAQMLLELYETMYPDFDLTFAQKLCAMFELPLKKRVQNYSLGMKNTLYFICQLSSRCELTLMDEPFNGIDMEKRTMLYDILLRDYMEHPRTIIISSHNLEELSHVLSEIILIDKGKLYFYEDMDTVQNMMIRITGEEKQFHILQEKCKELPLSITRGELNTNAIYQASMESELAELARAEGLNVTALTPAEVCIQCTRQDKQTQMDALWEVK